MSDRPPRPILRLKNPPPAAAPAPPAAASPQWKCKPCGAAFAVDPTLADADPVRCPACNARLGRAAQFRADGPGEGVRARRVAG
jgi:DNA-directed RNA polymerase subunit RPC12/RpoP